jgi:ribonuclease G
VVNKELIINADSSEVNIALLEDKVLVELNKEKTNNNFAVGDVYLGRIKKIMPGLNAAFVDVGYEKDAFLHYLDLGPQINSFQKFTRNALAGKEAQVQMTEFEVEADIEKTGKIAQVLSPNQQILVQIAKEPISTKGPRISSEISFAGRYLVLVPFSNRLSISQKIKSVEERNRLKRLISSIRPKNYGVIIRTVAEGKRVADLDADLNSLVEKWESVAPKLYGAKAPQKIVSELDRTSAILRDMLNESFNHIHVDDPNVAEEVKNYIRTIAPDKVDIVKLYKGKVPIFDNFGIDKMLKNSFGKIVTIKSGVYLIIEHTEALHVIDVNSGHKVNSDSSQEENALAVNLEAATEIARQLRLRDMGGIIVVDFIDMHEGTNRRKLYTRLKDEMAKDNAKHTILPPSKFGLVQLTRQRVRPETNLSILEKCPTCSGTGEIKPSILLTDEIENNIQYLLQDQNEEYLMINVHPFVYAFLKQGGIFRSIQWKWYFKYKKWIHLNPVNAYQLTDYRFLNKNQDEIKM